MEYDGVPISAEDAEKLYQLADNTTLNYAFQTGNPREYEQLKIMEKLNRTVRGLKFRRIRK